DVLARRSFPDWLLSTRPTGCSGAVWADRVSAHAAIVKLERIESFMLLTGTIFHPTTGGHVLVCDSGRKTRLADRRRLLVDGDSRIAVDVGHVFRAARRG